MTVLTCGEVAPATIAELLGRYRLALELVPAGSAIAGSHWGDSEAGLIGRRVYVRPDTPAHSLLHEACHFVCMDPQRRATLHTDAGGDYAEENGVCYLQVLLSDWLPGMGRGRMLADMDAWGYSFRLGRSRAWFEQDAEDACAWLQRYGIIDCEGAPTWRLRE